MNSSLCLRAIFACKLKQLCVKHRFNDDLILTQQSRER